MYKNGILRLGIVLICLLAAPGRSQTRPADMPLTAVNRTRVVTAAAAAIERYHFDARRGAAIAAALRDRLRAGGFDQATGALTLTAAVGETLRTFGDTHLRFGYSADPQPLGFDDERTPDQHEEAAADWRRAGFGIQRVERLAGNVGVLTITAMPHPMYAGDAWASAMRLLDGRDALIIDATDNRGGTPEMVAFVITWLVGGEPVRLFDFVQRSATRQFWTNAWHPTPRYEGGPIFVLTSGRTHSAGEGLARELRAVARARIVGETTRGGSHGSRWLVFDPHFAVSIPWARTVSAAVGEVQNGVGIAPDIPVSADAALETAHREALATLIASARNAEQRETLETALRELGSQHETTDSPPP